MLLAGEPIIFDKIGRRLVHSLNQSVRQFLSSQVGHPQIAFTPTKYCLKRGVCKK
jgi:hypothetical protein